MTIMFTYGDGPFQQDNVHNIRTGSVSGCFEEYQSLIAEGHDLNPIEHLRSEFGKQLQRLETPPPNLTSDPTSIMSTSKYSSP